MACWTLARSVGGSKMLGQEELRGFVGSSGWGDLRGRGGVLARKFDGSKLTALISSYDLF
eukprot:768599-Hanusia_phi.AAC.5